MARYLDAAEFTELFRNNTGNRNRSRILAGLHLMAGEISQKFHAWGNEQLEDATADAVLLAAEKIDCFDCRRKDAFSYFTTILFRAIGRRLSAEAKLQRNRGRFFSHEDGREEEGGRYIRFAPEQIKMAW